METEKKTGGFQQGIFCAATQNVLDEAKRSAIERQIAQTDMTCWEILKSLESCIKRMEEIMVEESTSFAEVALLAERAADLGRTAAILRTEMHRETCQRFGC